MRRHTLFPSTINWRRVCTVSLGVTVAIGTVSLLTDVTHYLLLVTSLGASSLILFGFPDSAFAQPRNFLGGNFLTAAVGLGVLHLFGQAWWSTAIATGLAVAAMMSTDTVHPPAASNPLTISVLHPGWSYLLFPNLAGEILVLCLALLFHRMARRDYPSYWI